MASPTTSLTGPAIRPPEPSASPETVATAPLEPPPPPFGGPLSNSDRNGGNPAASGSVSFAPSGTPHPGNPVPAPQWGAEGHGLIGVGPGRPGRGLRAGLMSQYPFPITGAKIHSPLLRSDTLVRPRLNDWLDRAAAGRVALIVAEAGFGKTTLLADWAARTSRRIAWYRLEPDDKDWLVFARHLVAAGRELDPDFAADSLELILALGSGGSQQEDIVASLAREYGDFAATQPDGLTLILDDHHAIDGSPETDAILRSLIERTGSGLSIVISSRAAPKLPLGRLRARGGLSRIEGEDLCFDVAETDRLFREAYHRPLEPDIVAELIKRTEGWAALLTLVRTSLEDKDAPEARALVAQLSATHGDMYDFLAEEVLETLSPSQQRFLTRVSVLVSVDAETGSLVDGRAPAELAPLITEAETLGLLTRPDRESPHRFHPLVRDFLVARLREEVGDTRVREMHAIVAAYLEPTDWYGSTWHYLEAGDAPHAMRVLDRAVPEILAAGTLELAAQFLDGTAGSPDRPAALLLRSRVELDRGHYERALELATRASSASETELAAIALLNLGFLRSILGYGKEFVTIAETALGGSLPSDQADLARAAIVVAGSQDEGNLEEVSDHLERLAAAQSSRGHSRYAAVSRLNRAWMLLWLGRIDDAYALASTAEVEFGKSARSVYRVGAMMARAHALARLERWGEAKDVIRASLESASDLARDEAAIEGGSLHVDFGDMDEAESVLASRGSAAPQPEYASVQALPLAGLALRRGDIDGAERLAAHLGEGPYRDVAGRLRTQMLRARISVARRDANADVLIDELERLARVQRSPIGLHCAALLRGVHRRSGLSAAVDAVPPASSYVFSMVTEELARSLPFLSAAALDRVKREASLRPDRWMPGLWLSIAIGGDVADRSARLVAELGGSTDAARLRDAAKGDKQIRIHAARATRRLARPVLVDDLGSVANLRGRRARAGSPTQESRGAALLSGNAPWHVRDAR